MRKNAYENLCPDPLLDKRTLDNVELTSPVILVKGSIPLKKSGIL